MEIEYFVNPNKIDYCPYFDEVKDFRINLLTASAQEEGSEQTEKITIEDAVSEKLIQNKWHAYWIAKSLEWM